MSGPAPRVARLAQRVKLRHLSLLVAVASWGNIQRAAREIGVSQPAATKMIQDLETDFGAPLFTRTNRGVIPTDAGAVLIQHAKLIFAQLGNAAQAIDDLSEGHRGRVVVGTLLAASSRLLPRALDRLLAERRGVAVRVIEGTNERLMPALRAGEIDMVLGRLPSQRHREDLRQQVLYTERILAVAGPGHPLAGRAGLTLADLMAQGWILPPPETTLRRQIDGFFAEAGQPGPQVRVESVSYLTNRALLQGDRLIGLMPAHVAADDIAAGRLAALDWPVPVGEGPVGVTLRAEGPLSPAAGALLADLAAVAATIEA